MTVLGSGSVGLAVAASYAQAGQQVTDTLVVASLDGTATQAITVAITGAGDTPAVTSAATASFAENGTGTVYTAAGTDPDAGTSLAWSLSGTDAALFNLNAATGVLTFKAAPDYEAPADAGGDNVYDVTITATDGALSASQALAISVSNIPETINLDAVALGTGGFKIIGEATGDDLSGYALSTIGDLNGDGKPEILAGAFNNDAGGSNAGAAYVVWGKATGTAVNLDDVALGTGGFRIIGENANDILSRMALTTIGDLNGDGKPEILVGASGNDAGGIDAGAAYVVWGKADGTAVNLDDVALGTGGFKIFGENAGDGLSNGGMTAIGDLNGDGKPEILVGAIGNSAGGNFAGAA